MANQQYTGKSEKLDFAEALNNAISQIPRTGADRPISAKVVTIEYTGSGDFSGTARPTLHVTVESNY